VQPKKKSTLPIIIAGLVLLALYTRLAFVPNAVKEVYLYLALFGLAFVIYIPCVLWARKTEMDARSIWLMIGFAIAFRAVFIGVWPSISTDFYRYVWDGKVANAGINPYKYCPASPKLATLRKDYPHKINYSGWKSPYPPGAQLIFGAIYRVKPDSQVPLKVTFLLFDLATMLLILRLLTALSLPRSWVIVYAWSPLIVTELASSGHVDVMGITAMMLALTLSVTPGGRSQTGPAALAWSAMLKPFSVPLIPMFVRRHGWKAVLIGAIVLFALAAPYVHEWQAMLSTPTTMAKSTRVNCRLFITFEAIGKLIGIRGDLFAKAMGGLLVLVFAVRAAMVDPNDNRRMLNSAMSVIGITLLVSPIMYPWYATWIIPFLCFSLSPAWLAFSGLVAVSYLLPFLHRPSWIWMVEYLPLYGLLMVGALNRWKSTAAGAGLTYPGNNSRFGK
jgi:alpha-1,6-mannosyltransferase